MKNKLNLIPLFLIVIYILFVGGNEKVNFETKLILLILLAFFSTYIIYLGYKSKTISKYKIIILFIFIGISLMSFLWSLNLI
jgi:hypothetical protein